MRTSTENIARSHFDSNSSPSSPPDYGQVIYLPLPRNVVRIGGKPCRLSPSLRARIREMARECGR